MKANTIINGVGRAANKVLFQIKKNSPQLLVMGGLVAGAATIVAACKATLKVDEVLDEAKEKVDKIHNAVENGITQAGEEYSVEDSKKDLTRVYVQTGVKLVKLYGPTIVLGMVSGTSILAGYNVLHKRNAAITAAYAAIDKSFKEYRGRVVERFGEGLDHELKYNVKAAEVEETVIDGKGKEKTVKKTIDVVDPNAIGPYEVFFDNTSPCWEPNTEYNVMYLNAEMNAFTNKLRATKECIFLNDIFDRIGLPKTQEGQLMGWRYDKDRNWVDNKIDYVIKEVYRPNEYVEGGYEKVLLIEFRVDGNVWKTM